jgi:hypothetical protein
MVYMGLYGFMRGVCVELYINEYKQGSPLIIEGFRRLVVECQNHCMKF